MAQNALHEKHKVGLAMTQAFNDVSHYHDDLPIEVRQMQQASEIRRYKYEIQDLKKTLKINKEIMSSVMLEMMTKDKQVQELSKQCQENKKVIKELSSEIEQFEDKLLILNQIKSFHEQAANDAENF